MWNAFAFFHPREYRVCFLLVRGDFCSAGGEWGGKEAMCCFGGSRGGCRVGLWMRMRGGFIDLGFGNRVRVWVVEYDRGWFLCCGRN